MLHLRSLLPDGAAIRTLVGQHWAKPVISVLLAAAPGWTSTVSGPRSETVSVERSRALMGTLCTAVARGADGTHLSAGLASAFDEIARLEAVMSSWRTDSEVARLNGASGSRFTCSTDLFAVLDSARALAEQTHGAFDATVEPLSKAWDLRGVGRVPTERERQSSLELVDWRRMDLDLPRHMIRLEPGMGVDLGGIGKGFALDRALDLLRARDIGDALLNFGGEVIAIGAEAPGADGWLVQVAHPRDRLRPAVDLRVANAAVSTSGQSERSYRVGARRYGHILDPRSGHPVASPASVTVVAGSATRADALSTALLVMGRAGAEAWCREHPDVGVLWLEPRNATLQAWAWNLPHARSSAGQAIQWRTSATRALNSIPQPH